MEAPTDHAMTEQARGSNRGRGRGRPLSRGNRPTAPSRASTPRKRKKPERPDPDASYDEKPQETRGPSMMGKKQLYEHYKSMEEAHRIELQKLQGELERCQKFQSAYLALCGNLDGGEMDDEKIRTRFSEIRELCSSWVSKFSSSGPLTPDDELVIKDVNPAAMDESDLEAIFAALRGEHYGKNIVLHFFLSHFICGRIINCPFFFLGPLGNSSSAQRGVNIEESLRKIIQSCPNRKPISFSTHDIQIADDPYLELSSDTLYAWVFDTLYLLQPNFYKGKAESFELALTWRANFYRNVANVFLKNIPGVLFKPLSSEQDKTERFNELEEAIRASGELVLKLRDQKVGIRSKVIKMEFQRNSEIIEPHPAMLLPPRDNRLNGQAIDFVVEPAIFAVWDDKETKTRREKCWSKAVVWVAGREQAFRGETCVGNDSNIALDSVVEDGSSQTPNNSATHARSSNAQRSSDSDVQMSDLSNDVGQKQQEAASPCQASEMDGKGAESKENKMEYTVDLDDQPAAGKIQDSRARADSTPLKTGQDFLGKESGNIEGQRISPSPNPEPTPGTENEFSHRAIENPPPIKEENSPCEEFRRSISEYKDDDGSSGGSERIQASPPEETADPDGPNGAQCDRFSNESSDELHVPGRRSAQKGRARGICGTTGTEKTPTAAVSHDENCSCGDCLFSDWLHPDPSPQSHHAAGTESIPNLSGPLHSPPERANASTTASERDAMSSNNDAYKKERSKDSWNDLSSNISPQ
ncbi:hypothetical protein FQN50_007754 [Emmonsiellopsis sp. PD_5]|nr:hypothetical protein FQN50_007754 [Emmonsiellopsis sp. PD_5]